MSSKRIRFRLNVESDRSVRARIEVARPSDPVEVAADHARQAQVLPPVGGNAPIVTPPEGTWGSDALRLRAERVEPLEDQELRALDGRMSGRHSRGTPRGLSSAAEFNYDWDGVQDKPAGSRVRWFSSTLARRHDVCRSGRNSSADTANASRLSPCSHSSCDDEVGGILHEHPKDVIKPTPTRMETLVVEETPLTAPMLEADARFGNGAQETS